MNGSLHVQCGDEPMQGPWEAAETTNAATVPVSVCCGFWALVNPSLLSVRTTQVGWILYIRQAARTTVHLLKRSISAYMASLYMAGDFDR